MEVEATTGALWIQDLHGSKEHVSKGGNMPTFSRAGSRSLGPAQKFLGRLRPVCSITRFPVINGVGVLPSLTLLSQIAQILLQFWTRDSHIYTKTEKLVSHFNTPKSPDSRISLNDTPFQKNLFIQKHSVLIPEKSYQKITPILLPFHLENAFPHPISSLSVVKQPP